MFREWQFLLGEIWILLALATLLGLFVGWVIWGQVSRYKLEAERLEAELNACRINLDECHAKIDLNYDPNVNIGVPVVDLEENVSTSDIDYDGDGIKEGKDEGVRPEALNSARDGVADDLKQIKGIGVKMEALCNSLGFFHFDQIGNWSGDEIAWVDANLEGFKGRVTRDEWVQQAKILARGGATKFSKKVEDGDVSY